MIALHNHARQNRAISKQLPLWNYFNSSLNNNNTKTVLVLKNNHNKTTIRSLYHLLMHVVITIYKQSIMFFKLDAKTPIMDIMTRKPKLDVHTNIITEAGIQHTHDTTAHLLKYLLFKF